MKLVIHYFILHTSIYMHICTCIHIFSIHFSLYNKLMTHEMINNTKIRKTIHGMFWVSNYDFNHGITFIPFLCTCKHVHMHKHTHTHAWTPYYEFFIFFLIKINFFTWKWEVACVMPTSTIWDNIVLGCWIL